MENKALVAQLNKELAIGLPEKIGSEDLQASMINFINNLIQYQFEQLISLLYRIDVSEAKIKNFLQQQPGEDAARIITALIIERELEKIKTRAQFQSTDTNINEEDKW